MGKNIFKVAVADPEGGEDWVHISGIHGHISLCGWYHMSHVATEDPVTCPKCIALIKFCKSIKDEDLW
jgi:hypothetical protein